VSITAIADRFLTSVTHPAIFECLASKSWRYYRWGHAVIGSLKNDDRWVKNRLILANEIDYY